MKQAHKVLAAGLVTAASMGMAGASQAQYVEGTNDAGQTLATAAATGVFNPMGTQPALPSISGTIGTAADADLYKIDITDPATFSATVTSVAGIDTALFLFDASGTPIASNDDASDATFNPTLAAGNTLYSGLSAGLYYLGISLSGNEPVNSADQLLFTTDQPSTLVRGAVSGLNPATESDFNDQPSVAETGDYNIALTATSAVAPVPEPSAYALVIAGVAASAVTLLRRRRRAV